MKAGEILIDLRLEDGQFSARVKNAEGLMRELRRNLSETAESTKRLDNHFGSLSTTFRHFMLTVGSIRFALMDFQDIFLTLPLSILKTSGEVERLTKMLEGLSTQADDAARKQEALANTKFVFNMAQNAPFEVKALTDAFVKFKVGGIDPTNGSLQALTDSVAKFGGDSQALHRASIAIQQMAGKGVVSMEELRQQLGEAVPNAIEMMAVGTGRSMAQLVKDVSTGTVEAKSAIERMFMAMNAANGGAGAAMMDTWTGMLERMKTKWELMKVEMGGGLDGKEGLFGTAKEELSALLDEMDSGKFRGIQTDLAFITAEGAKGFAALTEGVVKFYEEIKLAGEAFIAYFVASKVIGSGDGAFKSMSANYKAELDKINQANLESFNLKANQHNLEKQAAREKLTDLQKEAAAEQANYAKLNGHYNDYIAKQQEAQKIVDTGRLGRNRASKENVALAQAQLVAIEQELAATKANAIAHRGRVVALEQEIAAQTAHIAKLEQEVIAQNQVTMAGRTWLGMKMLMQGMWVAMGGLIGIATAALTVGIMALMDYASAAERAAERARNAMRGISTEKDRAAAKDKLDEVETDIKLSEAKLFSPFAFEREQAKKDIQALKEQKSKLSHEIATHDENLLNDRVKAFTESEMRAAQRQAAASQKTWQASQRQELADLQKRREEAERAGGGKLTEAQEKKFTSEKTDIFKRTGLGALKSERSTYGTRIEELTKTLARATGEDYEKANALLKEYQGKVEGLDSQIKSFEEKFGTEGTTLSSKKKGGPGGGAKAQIIDGLKKYTDDLNADLENIKVRWANVKDNVKGFEGVYKEAWTEIQGMLSKGQLDTKQGDKVLKRPKMEDLGSQIDSLAIKKLLEQAEAELPRLRAESETLQQEIADIEKGFETGDYSASKAQKEEHAFIKMLKKIEERSPQAAAEVRPVREEIEKIMALGKQKDADVVARGYLESTQKTMRDMRKAISIANAPDDKSARQARWQAELDDLQAEYEKQLKLVENSEAAKLKVIAQYAEMRALLEKKQQAEYKSPLETLAKEWGAIGDQIEKATAKWAQGAMDEMHKFITTGKADFKSFVASVLSDISKMYLQKAVGGAVTKGFDALGGMLGAATTAMGFSQGQQKGQAAPGADAGVNAAGSAAAAAAMGMKSLTGTSGALEAAMQSFRTEGLMASIVTFGQQIFAGTTEATASTQTAVQVFALGAMAEVASAALLQLVIATQTAAASETASAFFADGGIMSANGPLPLKMYANGGIANSPQLAVFGEGSMNEAYVPLPDGRSIPVTLKTTGQPAQGGAVGQTVMINITVNEGDGGGEKSTTSNAGSDWNGVAQRVKAVVIEELAVQQRPGGVLYRS